VSIGYFDVLCCQCIKNYIHQKQSTYNVYTNSITYKTDPYRDDLVKHQTTNHKSLQKQGGRRRQKIQSATAIGTIYVQKILQKYRTLVS
jgi:hypothetical protein